MDKPNVQRENNTIADANGLLLKTLVPPRMPAISKEYFLNKVGACFPPESHDFVYGIFQRSRFSFRVSLPRKTKKGDFRYPSRHGGIPLITVNGDLCPYEFLLVFIHEVAHYNVFMQYHIKKQPAHGIVWKKEYHLLLQQLISSCPLPEKVCQAFARHLQNIKSSSALDPFLEELFRSYRVSPENEVYLNQLSVGDQFAFNGKFFMVDAFLRTRAICTNLRTRKRYYVQGCAPVIKITP